MTRPRSDDPLSAAHGAALGRSRLDSLTARRLLETERLTELGLAAQEARRRVHPEPEVTYIIDRNINYTNISYSWYGIYVYGFTNISAISSIENNRISNIQYGIRVYGYYSTEIVINENYITNIGYSAGF